MRHAMAISRIGLQSEKDFRLAGRWACASRLRGYNRPAIFGLHPTARERHDCEQRFAIAL